MTFQLDEFLGSKLRALYQRKKGRDLFDLWTAAGRTAVNPDRLVECFLRFLEHDGLRVSRAEFESNLIEKLTDTEFTGDVAPLLAPGVTWDIDAASDYVLDELVSRIPGKPWKRKGSSE